MAGNVCASPLTTYISNTAWGSAACVPTSADFYTTATYASLGNSNGVTSLCNKNCNADIQRCKAYVANAVYDETAGSWAVDCYLMTTQAPAPTLCDVGSRVARNDPAITNRADTPPIDDLVQGLQNVNDALTDIAAAAGGSPATAIPAVLLGIVDLTTAVAGVPVPAVGSLLDLPSADQEDLCAVVAQVTDSVTNVVGVLQALLNVPILGSQLDGPLETLQSTVNGLLNSILAGGLDCSLSSLTSSFVSPTISLTSPTIPITSPTISVTSPPTSITTPATSIPNVIYAAYRDDVSSCFSQSVTAAVRYCSFLLSKAPPVTKFSYTSTTTPVKTKTTTKFSTTSVCSVKKGPGARGIANDFPEHEAEEKRHPVPFGIAPRATPVSAPAPKCLQPKVYPGWNSVQACSCLASITALTQKTISTAPTATKIVTKAAVTTVQKPSVPTYKALASFPGSAANGGGSFNVLSREIPDAKGTSKRILLYSRPSNPSLGQVAMHISTPQTAPKAPNKLFGVSVENNNLKAYGLVAFSTAANTAVNVLGQLPDGSKPAQSFSSCTAPRVANGQVTCKVQNGDPAVFFEVPIPGQKGKFAVGVAANKAPKGAKVLALQASNWGTVIVGCGGSGK